MRVERYLLASMLLWSVACSDRSEQAATAPPAVEERPAAAETVATDTRRHFVVRLVSPEQATAESTGSRREALKQRTGFTDVVVMQPDERQEDVTLVEVSVWASEPDASAAARSMSGALGVYAPISKSGGDGPPTFGVPLGMILFESPNVSEAQFQAEVEVFGAVSQKAPQYQGILLKNTDPVGKVPFVYLMQWGSEAARQQVLDSQEYQAAVELARVQKTEIMKYLRLHRVD